jgi:hypothetical protein
LRRHRRFGQYSGDPSSPRLALVVKASEYLAGVHSELHDFQGHKAAEWDTLLSQVNGSHASFAQLTPDLITAEIVVVGCRRRYTDCLSSGLILANGAIESALDQTPGAKSRVGPLW